MSATTHVVAPRPAPALTGRDRGVITVEHLSKRFGNVLAVDDLTFGLARGTVTGFLGPNGAGKTTTLRMLLGLTRPTGGAALVFGVPYREIPNPAARVGAVLEATDFHPGRPGRDHLLMLAYAARLPRQRVDEVLSLVELSEPLDGGSAATPLGMRQRLGLPPRCSAIPSSRSSDEPANGLDPEGVHWLREFLRSFTGEGKTVLVSSHVLAEVAQTVDDVLIINRGRLVLTSDLQELIARGGEACTSCAGKRQGSTTFCSRTDTTPGSSTPASCSCSRRHDGGGR